MFKELPAILNKFARCGFKAKDIVNAHLNLLCSSEQPSYKMSGPEAYITNGNKTGNKYWINVPIDTSPSTIETIIEVVSRKSKDNKVKIGQQFFKATEITFFVYNELCKFTGFIKIAGSDLADLIYEWDVEKGILKRIK